MYKMNSNTDEEVKNIQRKSLEITHKQLLCVNLNLFRQYKKVCV
jgi:hypothetical protein